MTSTHEVPVKTCAICGSFTSLNLCVCCCEALGSAGVEDAYRAAFDRRNEFARFMIHEGGLTLDVVRRVRAARKMIPSPSFSWESSFFPRRWVVAVMLDGATCRTRGEVEQFCAAQDPPITTLLEATACMILLMIEHPLDPRFSVVKADFRRFNTPTFLPSRKAVEAVVEMHASRAKFARTPST